MIEENKATDTMHQELSEIEMEAQACGHKVSDINNRIDELQKKLKALANDYEAERNIIMQELTVLQARLRKYVQIWSNMLHDYDNEFEQEEKLLP